MSKSTELDHFYLSAKEYAERTGLGYQDVLYQCGKGLFDCFKTEGGQWRIKIDNNAGREQFIKVMEENARLKSTLENLYAIIAKNIT